METVSPEQVRSQVQKFWRILSGKSGESLEEFYAPEGIVFTGKGRRTEPALLAAARRGRQLSTRATDANVELANIDVQIMGSVAIASYVYQFHAVKKSSDGGQTERNTRYGRATQIFLIGETGNLRIVHEHLSAGEAPEIEARA